MSDISIETVTIRGDNITVDLLLWRMFKRPMPGLVERVLDLNREIAEAEFLPVGAQVKIPIDAPQKSPVERPAVRLWGRSNAPR